MKIDFLRLFLKRLIVVVWFIRRYADKYFRTVELAKITAKNK